MFLLNIYQWFPFSFPFSLFLLPIPRSPQDIFVIKTRGKKDRTHTSAVPEILSELNDAEKGKLDNETNETALSHSARPASSTDDWDSQEEKTEKDTTTNTNTNTNTNTTTTNTTTNNTTTNTNTNTNTSKTPIQAKSTRRQSPGASPTSVGSGSSSGSPIVIKTNGKYSLSEEDLGDSDVRAVNTSTED